MVSHRERLETCLSNQKPDRPPVALWRHFPVDDQNPSDLARACLNFQKMFDFDLVKVTPASSFCIKDWGSQDEWHGATEGTRDYTNRIILHPEDWARLPLLDPNRGFLGEQLECLRLITQELGSQTPVIQTIFNPLAQAKNLVGGGNLIIHLRRYPDALHAGLHRIAESTRRFVEACLQTGIAGIFYAVQHAQYGLLTPAEYLEFGRAYDFQVLEPARESWLNLLHLHGDQVMFNQFLDYPVSILNWHDKETSPNLTEGQASFKGTVCGGLQREQALVLGTPHQVQQEARMAIQATGGLRFILGTGCVVPVHAPYGNLLAARQVVDL